METQLSHQHSKEMIWRLNLNPCLFTIVQKNLQSSRRKANACRRRLCGQRTAAGTSGCQAGRGEGNVYINAGLADAMKESAGEHAELSARA